MVPSATQALVPSQRGLVMSIFQQVLSFEPAATHVLVVNLFLLLLQAGVNPLHPPFELQTVHLLNADENLGKPLLIAAQVVSSVPSATQAEVFQRGFAAEMAAHVASSVAAATHVLVTDENLGKPLLIATQVVSSVPSATQAEVFQRGFAAEMAAHVASSVAAALHELVKSLPLHFLCGTVENLGKLLPVIAAHVESSVPSATHWFPFQRGAEAEIFQQEKSSVAELTN